MGITSKKANKPWNTAWGVVAETVTTTDVTFTTSETDIVSVTFTAVTGRNYLVEAKAEVYSTALSDSANFKITDGSNTKLERTYSTSVLANTAQDLQVRLHEVIAAGSATRKLRGVRTVGTGTWHAGNNEIAFIRVTDIGPA